MRDSYRAEPDRKLIAGLWPSVIGGTSAGAEDATGVDHVEAEGLGPSDDLRRFRAVIEPELTDGLALDLLEQTETNGGRYVEAHLVECGYGKGVEVRIGAQGLNLLEDGVARLVRCASSEFGYNGIDPGSAVREDGWN